MSLQLSTSNQYGLKKANYTPLGSAFVSGAAMSQALGVVVELGSAFVSGAAMSQALGVVVELFYRVNLVRALTC